MSLRSQFGGGEGVPSAFTQDTPPGSAVQGTITDVKVVQATEYRQDGKPGEPLTFDNGDPKQQVVITVKNDQLVGTLGPDDDGRRRIFIRTWYKSSREAMFAALDGAGNADDFEVGGQFAAQFLGKLNGEAWNSYKFEYKRPSKLGGAGLLDKPATAPAPAATVQQPTLPPAESPADIAARALAAMQAQQQPVAPPAPALDADTLNAVRTLVAAGMAGEAIRKTFPNVTAEILAALGSVA